MADWACGGRRKGRTRHWLCILSALTVVSVRLPARADVFQTGSQVRLPRDVSDAELDLVAGPYGYDPHTQSFRGLDGAQLDMPIIYGEYYSPSAFPQFEDGDAITLEGMFKWQRESIDPIADAKVAAAFVPGCELEVELLLLGGTCRSALYWYNVPTGGGSAPSEQELYEVLPADIPSFMQCRSSDGSPKTDGFCPLAWDNRMPRDLSKLAWQPRSLRFDPRQDVRYTGGAIGFALRPSVSSSYCAPATYSVREHNVRSSTGDPFVTALEYESSREPGSVYFAFEDGPMLPGDWTNKGSTDGDFNDYVFRVSGCSEGENGGGGAGPSNQAGAGQGGGSDAAAGLGPGGANATGGSAATSGGAPPVQGGPASSGGGAGVVDEGIDRNQGGGVEPEMHPVASSDDSSGCGCRMQAQRSAVGAESLLALAALLFRRARIRSRNLPRTRGPTP